LGVCGNLEKAQKGIRSCCDFSALFLHRNLSQLRDLCRSAYNTAEAAYKKNRSFTSATYVNDDQRLLSVQHSQRMTGRLKRSTRRVLPEVNMRMMDFISETLSSRKKLFISATALTVLLKLSTIAPALLLGKIIDNLTVEENLATLTLSDLLIVLCAAVLLQSILHPLQTYQLVKLVQTTLADLSTEWSEKILGKEFEQFSSLRIGGLIKSVERGITAHEKFLIFFITSGFPLLIELGLIAIIFASLAGPIMFMTLLGVSVVYILLYHRLICWRRPYLVAVNDEEDRVSSKLFETLQAGKILKLEQACGLAMKPLRQRYTEYAHAATRVASTGAALSSIKVLYMGLSTAGLLAWGVSDQASISPRLTVGELVAVFSLAGMFLSNCSALAEAYRALDQFSVDRQRLRETLSLEDLIDAPQEPITAPLSSLELVAMAQVTNRKLHFTPEQSVAIIGPSGAGKSTLLDTMAGTLKTVRHGIFINGREVGGCDIQTYLDRVRYCPQDPVFLEGTFKHSVKHSVLFDQPMSEHLPRILEDLGVAQLAAHRLIAEGAINISGGEAKRLSLLRLLNRPGDFNLFDEPTSGLDQETASRVWTTLFEHFHKRGLVCATHDLSALSRFDRVIVLKNGDVIADGLWSELQNDGIVNQALAQIRSF
jgi:ATP-binding cassette subfamily B protein